VYDILKQLMEKIMSDIIVHIEKTQNLLNKLKLKLEKELRMCENDLVSFEIRESLQKLERKEKRFNNIKKNLVEKFNIKDSDSLKRIYKYLKRNLNE